MSQNECSLEDSYKSYKYRDYLYLKKLPKWSGPHCNLGYLEMTQNKINYRETVETERLSFQEEVYHTDYEFIFSEYFKCSKCLEFTAVVGSGEYKHFIRKHDFEEYPEWIQLIFMPKYFYPPLHLFQIPTKTPTEVRVSLIESFALAWSDFSAAANKLRISIEHLVDNIDKNLTGKIHSKIEQLKKNDNYRDIATMLMAIKWIGNEGSHYKVKMQEHDVALGYKIMEEVLNSLYAKPQLIDFSRIIINKRGTLIKET